MSEGRQETGGFDFRRHTETTRVCGACNGRGKCLQGGLLGLPNAFREVYCEKCNGTGYLPR